MSILQYGFMQRAFLVGILLAVITPCIGITIVLKRMSMIGDALSHASLAGVALGLLVGINPVFGAGIVCIFAALGIEGIRKKLPRYSEMAIAIVMSAGIGLAGVLSGFVKNNANFNSFLFGSIVSISGGELLMVCIVSLLVLSALLLFSKELFYIGFDENAARISGVPVRQINFMFTILTALTVSIASRTVGALIVSSMLVVPVACGMQMAKSYKMTLVCAIIAALSTTIGGLFLSYYAGLKPGGTIVLLEVIWFLVVVMVKTLKKRLGSP
jgi:zinc transport system permease protein